MPKKITIDEIAREAFVSRSVVSRVLNNHPHVSAEARARVQQVIDAHNYRPSSVARSLATDRTHEICILMPRRKDDVLATGLWMLMVLGISEQCSNRGYHVSVTLVSGEDEADLPERVVYGRQYDGYLLITRAVTQKVVPAIRKRNSPVVIIGHDAEYAEFPSVDVDNFMGAYEATAHLCKQGHTRIAAIMGASRTHHADERLRGYRQALKDHNLSPDPLLLAQGEYAPQNGFRIVQDWLASSVSFSALFCASDALAMGALLALHEGGVAVPDQVAVVGFDDLPNAAYTYPPLSTIRQPIYEKGVAAAKLLIDQIEGASDEPQHLMLAPELIVRRSSVPL